MVQVIVGSMILIWVISNEEINFDGSVLPPFIKNDKYRKSNCKVIFRKFRSEIVEYLQRYSSFSVRNGTAEISLPFAKLSSFQSLIREQKQLQEIELQMVSAISFGWFADFGKTLAIIQRSSEPVYSDKW